MASCCLTLKIVHFSFKSKSNETYIMAFFSNESADYVGLVLTSAFERYKNFCFQFQFTNIVSRVGFIAFFSKFTVDTVLSLKSEKDKRKIYINLGYLSFKTKVNRAMLQRHEPCVQLLSSCVSGVPFKVLL